ncbi:MAG: sigma-54-dependent Fis family transcriptional regulator [Nitrospirae bacterium]|nr:sigma-54-dependent Fis family transcriptional regulator [Nitrospirota bacterium]
MQQPIYPEHPILLVDDEPMILLSFGTILRKSGVNNFQTIEDSRQVMQALEDQPVAAVVLDLSMPHVSGLELLGKINENYPEILVIVVTATDDIETAVACMRSGAFDYLVKPVEMNRFISSIRKALDISSLMNEVSSLKHHLLTESLEHETAFSSIVTESKKMRSLFHYAEAISASPQSVLITGETGTGKELFARAIHDASCRKGAFIALNISGLDDTMFSDTLFGHKKGAYTGADTVREGQIAQTAGGTLFLDEIGDLSETSQVKLLRLLQEKQYFPLGSDVPKQSDARVIVATNRDIQQLIDNGRFRKDLYYRLRTHHIHIPPLRERLEDIPDLLDHFIKAAATSLRKNPPSYPRELVTLLSTYQFPGNVRELEAMVFDAVARHRTGKLSLDSFRETIQHDQDLHPIVLPADDEAAILLTKLFGRFPSLREAEDHLVAEAVRLSDNNQGIAASLLGISRQALNKRLSKKKSH